MPERVRLTVWDPCPSLSARDVRTIRWTEDCALCSPWLNKSVWLIVSFFLVLRTDIASEFKEQLQTLILHVLNPANLMEKEINGSKVTCRGLLEYFKVNMGFSSLKYLTFGETDTGYELGVLKLGGSWKAKPFQTPLSFQEWATGWQYWSRHQMDVLCTLLEEWFLWLKEDCSSRKMVWRGG